VQSESMHLPANGKSIAVAPHAAFPEVQHRTLVHTGLLPQRKQIQPLLNRVCRFQTPINRLSRSQKQFSPPTLCED
jgi:hypothetical protein